ncbi:calcium-binding mitochondrial carrier protein Aralar1 isoform X2 [Folsomia candida]|uniref:calcium-binding mitochondrial carrier protein Aralar1 isoform X2 n=1 Tax=Folsomia candida TaxID=158441 RepID=UPI000B907BFB|nr:calcium-binding mitochondrial carrier protein Aralar1 isoform X2 [Folsomia candida]
MSSENKPATTSYKQTVTSTADYLAPGYLKRASTPALFSVFKKYASVTLTDELTGTPTPYMTASDFIQSYLGLFNEPPHNAKSVALLAGIIDTSKDNLISFPEFQAFEGLLCLPDALYQLAFQLFDTKGTGLVTFEEFQEVIKHTVTFKRIPFDLDGGFVKLYFGKSKNRIITYAEFSQFLHDFHEEYAVEAFRRFDTNGTGFISALDFANIMTQIKRHLLTKEVQENLMGITHAQKVSFPFFMAFNSLLNNMELVKKIYLNATAGSRGTELTKEEFLHSAQMMSQITPLEVDILFLLCDLLHQTGRIQYSDLQAIAPEHYFKQITKRFADFKAVERPEDRGVGMMILESAYRFTLGALAGAVGATAVYPIDLVKTRMQNQRSGSYIGELMYRSSADCFRKVIRHEGFGGLYRGLVPQLMGVAPEKAIKLTVNDLVRDKLTRNNTIPVWGEVVAGASAGASQVVFTNPLEIVKIRLQVAGEIASQGKIGGWSVVKELGFLGLYKGAKACFLRDVPFSAIYFPVYAHTKVKFQDDNGYNAPWTLLVSGAIAGIPAASLVTPADVIKTRLQVVARAGQTTYDGVMDATKKIWKEEGGKAFWKGAGARVLRSSPQFGVTLVTYEILQRLFYIDFGGSRPAGSELNLPATGLIEQGSKPSNPDHIGGFEVALPILSGIESKFGLLFPKFSHGRGLN